MDPKIGINRPILSPDLCFNTTKMNTKKSLDLGFDPLWTNSILSYLFILDELPQYSITMNINGRYFTENQWIVYHFKIEKLFFFKKFISWETLFLILKVAHTVICSHNHRSFQMTSKNWAFTGDNYSVTLWHLWSNLKEQLAKGSIGCKLVAALRHILRN